MGTTSTAEGGLLMAVVIMQLLAAAIASDPELTTDFATIMHNASADNFTFTGLRGGAKARPGSFKTVRVFVDSFPALEGLGISAALLEFHPSTHSAPHIHPRGTELFYVMEGSLMVGLVDTAGHFFNQTLQTGDLFVFPKGLLHFEVNPSTAQKAVAFSSFSGSNPATISIPATLFGSGIPPAVLAQAFHVDDSALAQLQAPFAPRQ
ncbi:hypothetical protein GOP47_0017374 [Adiantum capillus-veneris]|uniref:Germin-like protein n=1 Tax=Adiantum capillus-veneris TaxID=13818 RepID=A0A9D4UF79_ADICA|nr:hypothetical protein GOP47_0017374 [Adiantum capillus-veneris]